MDREILIYVGGFDMPDKNAAAHRVLTIGKILKEQGKNVIYIGTDKSSSVDDNILLTKKKYEGFDCYAIKYPQSYWEWVPYLSSAKKYIDVIKTIGKVQGIIFYNFPSMAMAHLLKYCRKNNIKCYADVTEWYSGKGHGIIWGVLKTSDTWYRMHIMHNKMDGMIVISRYLESYYKKRPNVVRVPILTDLTDSKWENHYEKSRDILKLVYAGWPERKDRIDYLIEALMNVKRSYHLDVVGITLKQYLDLYPKHKEWLEKNRRISFCGRISHEEALEYIKRANYSCFFRQNDRVSKAGFPTKFVEAISCGTPVITNNTSDLAEYMKNGKNGKLLLDVTPSLIAETIENADFISETDASIFDYKRYKDLVLLTFTQIF